MEASWRNLLKPLNLAGLFTWAAVAYTIFLSSSANTLECWLAALLFLLAFFGEEWAAKHSFAHVLMFVLQAVSALALIWLMPSAGVAPVLLVMLLASIATCWPPRAVFVTALALNVVMYGILRAQGNDHALTMVLVYASFQMFAALISHYARTAEEARDRLAAVNAELLATRSLLADTSRDAERMRLARELHDVAGHKLTALRLNLRALSAAADASPELKLADQLSADLLGDIRGVVHALREVDGLNIATALQALAAPFPRPRLAIDIDPAAHITNPQQAETILRIVQEALTNTARHNEAQTLHVQLMREGSAWKLHVEDDANDVRRAKFPIREGNGLSGMRERVASLGGRISISRAARGGVVIEASLPA